MQDWKLQATGWIDERNFEIDTAQGDSGYSFRVRVIGFPMMEEQQVFATAESAQSAALEFLQQQFTGKVSLE